VANFSTRRARWLAMMTLFLAKKFCRSSGIVILRSFYRLAMLCGDGSSQPAAWKSRCESPFHGGS